MSNISKHTKTGKYRVRFRLEGKEYCILLPTKDKKKATNISSMISRLVECKKTGEQDSVVNNWITTIPAELYSKIAKVGLVKELCNYTVMDLFNQYVESKPLLEKTTVADLRGVATDLSDYFGDRDIRSITASDAFDYRKWLENRPHKVKKGVVPKRLSSKLLKEKVSLGRYKPRKLARSTVNSRINKTKIFFNFAVKREYISKSPFTEVRAGGTANEERQFFVSREASQKILDACYNNKFRAIFALARFVGLRIDSEIRTLKWSDIHWSDPSKEGAESAGSILIHDKKRKRYSSKSTRVSPLWHEAEVELLALYNEAEPGEEYVFPKLVKNSSYSSMERIVVRAGLPLYPKIFHNLRSSLETEYQQAGIDPVTYTRWLGNSPVVAVKHYIQYNMESFNRGVTQFTVSARVSVNSVEQARTE